jgi:hypothetical protein
MIPRSTKMSLTVNITLKFHYKSSELIINFCTWKVSYPTLQRFTFQVHLYYDSRDVLYIYQWCTTTRSSLLHLLYICSTTISCDNYKNSDAIQITTQYSWELHLLVLHWKYLHLPHDWKDAIQNYEHLYNIFRITYISPTTEEMYIYTLYIPTTTKE